MLRRIRWLVYGLIVVVLLAAGVVVLHPWGVGAGLEGAASRVAGVALPGGVSLGGPFQLTDDQGHAVTNATYRGRWMLVYFGYTFCPDVCPTELQTISAALDKLGKQAAQVVPLFITIDPERDTTQTMAGYVKLFDSRLIGLTGTPAQIAAVAHAYRVYYAKVDTKDPKNYLMDHSAFIYLMGPDGQFRALFREGTDAQALANGIRARMGTS